MNHSIPRACTGFLVAAFAVGLVGCDQKGAETPQTSSSQGSYAAEFPDRLAKESKGIRAEEAKAKEDAGTMPTFADSLGNDANWDLVLSIVEAADKAGRDGGYADAAKSNGMVKSFFEEEKDPLLKKVGGSAQYAVKQKGCDADVYGAVSQGMKDGVEDRIQARMRAKNDAFILIERNKEAIGKKNQPLLENEADKIAEASWLVHTEMPEAKQRLDHYLGEVSSSKSAIEDLIKDEKEFATANKLKPEDQKSSDARIKGWEDDLKALDAAEQDAKQNAQDLEQRIAQSQKDYDAAFSAMKDAIKAKKK